MKARFERLLNTGGRKVSEERLHCFVIHLCRSRLTWFDRELVNYIHLIHTKVNTVVNNTLIDVSRDIWGEEVTPKLVVADKGAIIL